MEASPETPTEKKQQKPTEYVVLERVEKEGEPQFRIVGGVEAGIPQSYAATAREKAVKEASAGKAGVFIAVPLASFKPIKFEVEQVPKENFEAVTL